MDELKEYCKKKDISEEYYSEYKTEAGESADKLFYLLCHCYSIDLEGIKLCVKSGGDINSKHLYNVTPFHALCRFSDKNNFNLAALKYCMANDGSNKYKKCFKYIGKNKLVSSDIIQQCLKDKALKISDYYKYFVDSIVIDA